jgi:glycosyltransferase involved in cell wall biosynthesis
MKVAMVTAFPEDPKSIVGGISGVAKYLVDELATRQSVEVVVVVPKGATQSTVCEKWGSFDVYRLAKEGSWSFLFGTFYDIFAGKRQIKNFLRQLNPDIVHFQGVTFLAAGCEYPNVLTIHGIAEKDAIWDNRWGALRYLKWLLLKLTEGYGRRCVSRVILISDYVGGFLPDSKIRKTWRIDNPIADSFFDVDRQFESGRIFCCSKIRPLKNIVGMIRAAALIARKFPHSQLRLAGTAEPAYLRECIKQIEQAGLHDSVHFLGSLSVKDVQRELSKANCLAIPSFQENAPLSVAEAMAVGVPVVGANVGGIPEMIEHGKTGFLVNPHDIQEIADAVCTILSNDRLAESMGQRAREIARRRYRASVVAEKTLQVYREILSES